jgi:hypothetical protein
MDVNLFFSVSIAISGLYSVLCFFQKPGKLLYPGLHHEAVSNLQRISVLFTGIFFVAAGLYGMYVETFF